MEADVSNAEPLRVVIISTPRSGNTWLRRLLAKSLGLNDRAVHHHKEIDWAKLPARCLFQIHWRRIEPFVSLLQKHQFRVVVIARHPLDVLISILHFAPSEPETIRWLAGQGGGESEILGENPGSRAFLEYACGPRAAALLSVSKEWWQAPGSVPVQYEKLVSDTLGEVQRITSALGSPLPPERITAAIEANTVEKLRVIWANQHIWHGRSNLWRSLIPAEKALKIAGIHADCFRELGYVCDPDASLTAEQAEKNWSLLS